MSTDHQQYSTANQRDALARYADDHGLTIVRTYGDEGKSGLTAAGRQGLCGLLGDVVEGRADFGVVLVYDVSRWGRFQDADESAYYEFLCRRAGIRIEYCMEVFRNDGSAMSAVMKGLKRVMAGEFSRELSDKVFRGKCRLTREGYRQGGSAGYGLRRMVVNSEGRPRGVLEPGEHKYLQKDHIVLVPGPAQEQAVVRWIFGQIARRRRTYGFVADRLNERGVPSTDERPWTAVRVRSIVRSEKYIGNLVFNKTSVRLRTKLKHNAPADWIRVNGAFPAVVDPKLFRRAQKVVNDWHPNLSNEAGLDALRKLLVLHGKLNSKLINSTQGVPGTGFFESRFGSLVAAYHLIGFDPERDFTYLIGYTQRCRQTAAFRVAVAEQLHNRGAIVIPEQKTVLQIDGRCRVAVMMCHCRTTDGTPRWIAQHHVRPRPDWMLVARLNASDDAILDYQLLASPPECVNLGARRDGGWGARCKHRSTAVDSLLDYIALQSACARKGMSC